jgi:hypothetical protein
MMSPVAPEFDAIVRAELKWIDGYIHNLWNRDDVLALVGERLEEARALLPMATGYPVVVAGEFSSGKSSLINSLVGDNILPVGLSVTTRSATRIAYGKPGAKVLLLNGKSYTYPFQFSADKNRLFPALDAAILNEDQRDAASRSIQGWLEYMTQHVVEIVGCDVLWPSEFLKAGIVLIDTPGVNSEDPTHRKIAQESLHHHKTCALFLFPCIGAGRESTFKLDIEHIQHFQSSLFVLTKSDLAETREQLLDVEALLRAKLIAKIATPPKKVYLVSTKGDAPVNELADLRAALMRRCEQAIVEDAPQRVTNLLTAVCADLSSIVPDTTAAAKDRYILQCLAAAFNDLLSLGKSRTTANVVCLECCAAFSAPAATMGTSGTRLLCPRCATNIDIGSGSPLVRICQHCLQATSACGPVCARCGAFTQLDYSTVLHNHSRREEERRQRARLLEKEAVLSKIKSNSRWAAFICAIGSGGTVAMAVSSSTELWPLGLVFSGVLLVVYLLFKAQADAESTRLFEPEETIAGEVDSVVASPIQQPPPTRLENSLPSNRSASELLQDLFAQAAAKNKSNSDRP